MARAFLYLAISLLAIQSTWAVADLHSSHQSGFEHLSYDDHQSSHHEHGNNEHELADKGEHDCNHCCHCHGHSTPAVTLSVNRFYSIKSASPVPDYTDKALQDTFETFLRPPIA